MVCDRRIQGSARFQRASFGILPKDLGADWKPANARWKRAVPSRSAVSLLRSSYGVPGRPPLQLLFLSEQLDHDFGQDQLVIELARDQPQIGLQARFHSFDQPLRFEAVRILRGDPERITADRPIFLAR